MIALGTRYRSSLGSAIRSHYLRWAIYGIVIGLLGVFHMDNAAHIGGLASGFAVAYIAGMPRPAARFQEQFWSIAGMASIALTVLAFVKMFLFFSARAL
jgi:membrane associated rhomboid family serine protease